MGGGGGWWRVWWWRVGNPLKDEGCNKGGAEGELEQRNR